ncbi:MAG: N-acetyltransferase [Clostridia bacterium]|nr:N-acetyltransferase [Clostridia bacterium]
MTLRTQEFFANKDTIILQGPVEANKLEQLSINPRLNNFRPALKQKEALIKISQMSQGMIFTACCHSEIIGYVTFHRPESYTRWFKHPAILEMGAVEVSLDWRKHNIGCQLLIFAFAAPQLEKFIGIATEYAWHWDLKASGLSVWDYQKMLTGIFQKANLTRYKTDEPEILSHPCNVLMAKIGSQLSAKEIRQFKDLLFLKQAGAS